MLLQEFSDWSQCAVLELAAAYRPSGESEVYDLMNALEDRLANPNSAVAMAAIKAFLHLTLDMVATHQQVGAVLHAAWITIVYGRHVEDTVEGRLASPKVPSLDGRRQRRSCTLDMGVTHQQAHSGGSSITSMLVACTPSPLPSPRR